MKKILFLLLFISSLANGQSVEELFSTANTFYKQGNLEMAIENYLEIDKQEEVSSELYYNLGNCYYKLNNVAETIYYYEKALKLNPLNEDARNNLVFAKRLTIDSIKELPKSILQKIILLCYLLGLNFLNKDNLRKNLVQLLILCYL